MKQIKLSKFKFYELSIKFTTVCLLFEIICRFAADLIFLLFSIKMLSDLTVYAIKFKAVCLLFETFVIVIRDYLHEIKEEIIENLKK